MIIAKSSNKSLEFPELILGSAWYPEQWSKAVWEQDMREMVELGFNTVRLAEFAWAKLEPEEGYYQFKWLADALDLLHQNGIGAILCTPTATPPIWLLNKYPEIGFVDEDDYQHRHGGRQHACYSNIDFRRYSRKITEEIAMEFGKHPALVAWQIDNELGSHQQRCFNEATIKRWAQWLEQRFGTIDNLNEAWKTVVWSQTYSDFSEVPPPYKLPCYSHNLSLKLNYRRFMTDVLVEFQREQIDIIRQHSDAPITHNSTSHHDEWRMSLHLDFASVDVYPYENAREGIQYRYDLMRKLNPAGRFVTMETSIEGIVDDELYRQGWTGCHAFINYCMGSGGFSFWPWRQQAGGAEIFHQAILHASGRRSSGWENAKEAAECRKLLSPLLKDFYPKKADVALVVSDYNARFCFLDRAGGIEHNFDYSKRILEWYSTLHELSVWRDVIFDEAEIEDYRLIFSPYLPYVRPELLDRLCALVEEGSTWVVGPYTGFLTEDNAIPEQAILGNLEQRIGFKTETLVMPGGLDVEINGRAATTSQFAAVFDPCEEDEVIGTYTTERFKGKAWGLRRKFGKGTIYILGSHIDEVSRRHFWKDLLHREGVEVNGNCDGLIEIPMVNHDHSKSALGICNWTYEEVDIEIPDKQLLAASSRTKLVGSKLHMPSQTWAFLQE
ncbi:beta-galactosidase [Cerasicoccus arenae]|uniref:Beta-galactosidase n=1 Tax=Cerasicoccus arenae TaxID=424488 RepID=A0A8J3DB85_9BACT|nr:beta-galactosidase [Cerasicoccus arenae]MBK1858598.1 beta-galactosidase [Cerasicoccus arenae]GHC05080.1 beta-galactosidase YesZ [Cerasicoccus arenae]